MLDVLRRNAGSWAIKFILGFIAVTFVWWGVGTYSERERNVAARVGDSVILMSDFSEAVSNLEKAYRDVYGNAFTPEMAKGLRLREQALTSLIRRKILLDEAKAMGLTATDVEVQRDIAATPAFQVDGQFREDRYRSVLEYNRVTPGQFEASKRDEITLRKIEGILSASARVTEREARELYDLTFRRIGLVVVAATPDHSGPVPAPTEGEIAAKYEQTREAYRIPARVKLAVARFDPAAFGERATLSEEEVRTYFEANPEEFRSEEARLLSQFLIPYGGDREEARRKGLEAAALATQGKAQFEEAAKRYGRGGIAGPTWLSRREIRPALAEAAFGAPVDGIAGPVDTGNGFAILRVAQVRFPEALPFDRVRDRVVAQLRREKGRDQAVIAAYEAHGKAIESKDLAGACAPYDIRPAGTGWIGEEGGDGVPPAVAREALLLPAGEVAPVQSVGEIHYLFRVAEKQESRLPALADVRGKVAEAVLRDRKREAARAKLAKALAASKTAAELSAAGRAENLVVTELPPFAPLGGELSGALASAPGVREELARRTPASPMAPKVYEAGQGFLTFALAKELPADPSEWESRGKAFAARLEEQKRQQVLEAFVADRQRELTVEVVHADLQ